MVRSVQSSPKNSVGDGSKLHLLQDISSSPGDSHEDSEGEGGGEEGDPHKCHSWGSQCRQDWRKILALVCLWMAYLLCNIAYSLIWQFFPQIVSPYQNSSHAVPSYLYTKYRSFVLLGYLVCSKLTSSIFHGAHILLSF